jgi:hypothetical protein
MSRKVAKIVRNIALELKKINLTPINSGFFLEIHIWPGFHIDLDTNILIKIGNF